MYQSVLGGRIELFPRRVHPSAMDPYRRWTTAQPSDAALLLAARNGDCAGLGLLLERYRPRLHAAALRLLGYGPEAEDAVHETFLVALRRLDDVRDPQAIGGWLHAVLRRCCLQHLRRRRGEVLTAVLPEIADDRAGAEERLERLALRDWVWGALHELPEPLRVTAMLRYFGSYPSYAEIAAILAVPIGTVRSRLSEAKLKLAEALLATAGLADGGMRSLADERQRFYTDAFHGLFGRGERDRFLDHFAEDLHLVWSGKAMRGRAHFAAEIDADLQARVRIHPQRVISSGHVTVVEGRFENPPEDPLHCPPGLAMVVFQRGDTAYRMHLHLAPRPPQREED